MDYDTIHYSELPVVLMRFLNNLTPNSKGILSLVAALVFLTFSDSIIKWLSPYYALHQIMLFRALFAIIVVLSIVKLEGGFHLLHTRRPLLHLLRGGLLVVANKYLTGFDQPKLCAMYVDKKLADVNTSGQSGHVCWTSAYRHVMASILPASAATIASQPDHFTFV